MGTERHPVPATADGRRDQSEHRQHHCTRRTDDSRKTKQHECQAERRKIEKRSIPALPSIHHTKCTGVGGKSDKESEHR